MKLPQEEESTEEWVRTVKNVKSYDLVTLTLTESSLDGIPQLLSVYLAHHYNSRKGYAYPSQAVLMSDLKRSERTIRNAIGDLAASEEWYIVTGRGGIASPRSQWASSRYYPRYEWFRGAVDRMADSGAGHNVERILANIEIIEISEKGFTRPSLAILPLSDVITLPAGLRPVLSDVEITNYMAGDIQDRQRAAAMVADIEAGKFSLIHTILKAKESAKILPSQYRGGVARWLWEFGLKNPVVAKDAGAWDKALQGKNQQNGQW